jgi:hypothetical protein
MNAEKPIPPEVDLKSLPTTTHPPRAPETVEGEIVQDKLDYKVDEITQGLKHIVGACRRGDGKRVAYWVGLVGRQTTNLCKEALRTVVSDDGGIIQRKGIIKP